MPNVIIFYRSPDSYSLPGLLSFLPALPVGSIILYNFILSCFNNSQEESKQGLVCYEFNIKANSSCSEVKLELYCMFIVDAILNFAVQECGSVMIVDWKTWNCPHTGS